MTRRHPPAERFLSAPRRGHVTGGIVVLVDLFVLGTLVAVRWRSRGTRVADAPSTHWLGQSAQPGSGLVWDASRMVTRAYVPFVVCALLVLVVCALGASTRRRALFGVGLLVTSGIAAEALKLALEPVLGPEAATLPSGHATLVVAACVALAALVPERHRLLGVCVLAFVASCGALGVVVAQWHRPGDAFAALCVVAISTVVARVLLEVKPSATQRTSQFGHAPAVELVVAALAGGATGVVMYQGWGSGLTGHSLSSIIGGLVTRWGLALGAALLVWFAARVGEGGTRALN